MPTIIVYGIPTTVEQDRLIGLASALKRVCASVPELKLEPDQFTVSIPVDWVASRDRVSIYIEGLDDRPERTSAVRTNLATVCARQVKAVFLQSRVACTVRPPVDPKDGVYVITKDAAGEVVGLV